MTFMPGKDHHNYKHGNCGKYHKTGAYKSWLSMIGRCNPANSDQYPAYAGSGISVCDRWAKSFESFLADMGPRPDGCTIDRIDPSKNYEPNNCRWATTREQALNRRNVIFTSVRGEDLCLHDISKKYGIPSTTINRRYSQGLRGEDLICPRNRNVHRVGTMVAGSKLTESDVMRIKQAMECGSRNADLAREFGVSRSVISEIRHGKAWGHVLLE